MPQTPAAPRRQLPDRDDRADVGQLILTQLNCSRSIFAVNGLAVDAFSFAAGRRCQGVAGSASATGIAREDRLTCQSMTDYDVTRYTVVRLSGVHHISPRHHPIKEGRPVNAAVAPRSSRGATLHMDTAAITVPTLSRATSSALLANVCRTAMGNEKGGSQVPTMLTGEGFE